MSMKTSRELKRAALLSLCGIGTLSGAAFSQESDGYSSGIFTLKPRVGLHFTSNDNIYTTPDQKFDSLIFQQTPELMVEIDPGQHRFELGYAGAYGLYERDTDDNYMDHHLSAAAFLDLGIRHKLDVSADAFLGHEDRGSGLTRGAAPGDNGFPPRPDEFTDRSAEIEYRFGAPDSTGLIELGLGTRNLEYDNNRERTRFFDRSQDIATAAFYYQFRPGTYFVVDAQHKDVSYDEQRLNEPRLDGQEVRLRAGLTWEPTGSTRGRISVGRVRKDFDDPTRAEFTGISWQADVRWSPRTYSHFDLQTSREPAETIGDGDFIDNRAYRVTWTHDWSDLWLTKARVSVRDQDFVGSERNEELTELTFELGYRIRRWLTLGFELERSSTASTINALEYGQMIYRLGMEIAP